MPKQGKSLAKLEDIRTSIHEVRGQKVILDADLARFYGVDTRSLNQAVKRNPAKFPPDFVFPLKNQDVTSLISQNVISNGGKGGRRKTIYAFTEHGALMAAEELDQHNEEIAGICQMLKELLEMQESEKKLLH